MKAFALVMVLTSATTGCAYAGVATMGDKVVIVRNGLFGARTVFVCRVTEQGAEKCQSNESP
jgi:aspartate aminotransferase-like enzyme